MKIRLELAFVHPHSVIVSNNFYLWPRLQALANFLSTLYFCRYYRPYLIKYVCIIIIIIIFAGFSGFV